MVAGLYAFSLLLVTQQCNHDSCEHSMQAKGKAKAVKKQEHDDEDEDDEEGHTADEEEEEEQEEADEHAETATEQPKIGNKAVVGPSSTPDSKSPAAADKSKTKSKAKKRAAN